MAQLKSTVVQGALTVTGNAVATKIIKTSGTSDQILMADGSTSSKSEILGLINAAVVLKGTLGTGGTITSLPTAAVGNLGYAYKVITAGTYASQAAKVGDMFICWQSGTSSYAWMLIPSGDDIEDTWRPIKLGGTQILANGNTTNALNFIAGTNVGITNSNGSLTFTATDTTYGAEKGIALSSGKFGHSNSAITAQSTKGLYKISYDAYGHITGTESFTLPTKNSWNYDDTYVKYSAAQTLTDAQKTQARTNIGAGTSNFSGNYNDLTNKPTIPTVNNGTLTIQKNGSTVATFTANQSGNTTANITVPNPTDYYWANVKVSSSSSTATTPSVQKIGITGSTTATANAAVTMEYDSSYKALKFVFA